VLLKLVLPTLQSRTERVQVDAIQAAIGEAMRPGARLLEFTAGLDDAAAHDCPPVTTYRMTLSETAWLRELRIAEGVNVAVGEVLAVLSTTPDEPLAGGPERSARVAIAAILRPNLW
jgi:hypothetical protein